MSQEADATMRMEDGDQVWRTKDGKLHRIGGPAVEWAGGSKEWWVKGRRIPKPL